MISGNAISEAPISAAIDGLPFGLYISGTSSVVGTPSLIRAGAAALVATAAIDATFRVFVFAQAALLSQASLTARPNFVIYAATKEFITRSDDQVANQPFDGTLEKSIQFDRSIVSGSGFGGVTLGWGELTLINAARDYDYLVREFSNDGRRVLLKVGRDQRDPQYNSFVTIFDGSASGNQVTRGALRVSLRDNTYKLNAPAQPNVYSASSLVGFVDANLYGTRIPKGFGYCRNAKPVLISAQNIWYQIHDGPVEEIVSVKSRGNPLAFDQDFASLVPFFTYGHPPDVQQYYSCKAFGLIGMSFVLEGEITVDFKGDKTGGVYAQTAPDIIKRVCLASPFMSEASFDAASFARVNAQQPAPVNYFLDPSSSATINDVVSDLATGIGGWAGFRRDALFDIGIVTAPSGIPSARYTDIDIKDIDSRELPSGVNPPPFRFRTIWGRNYTVMSLTDIAGALFGDAEELQFLTNPYTVSPSSASDQLSIKTDHPTAQDNEPIQSWFTLEADAVAEAQRLLELWSLTARSFYQVTLLNRQFVHDVGHVIEITYDRWDLVDGRLMLIVSVSEKTETGETIIIGLC